MRKKQNARVPCKSSYSTYILAYTYCKWGNFTKNENNIINLILLFFNFQALLIDSKFILFGVKRCPDLPFRGAHHTQHARPKHCQNGIRQGANQLCQWHMCALELNQRKFEIRKRVAQSERKRERKKNMLTLSSLHICHFYLAHKAQQISRT